MAAMRGLSLVLTHSDFCRLAGAAKSKGVTAATLLIQAIPGICRKAASEICDQPRDEVEEYHLTAVIERRAARAQAKFRLEGLP